LGASAADKKGIVVTHKLKAENEKQRS
jgi:hypothetical protein